MSLTTRFLLILALMLPLACGAFAQETSTATETAEAASTDTAATDTATTDTTATATTETAEQKPVNESSYETRNRFGNLLRNHPPEVASILVLDPTLMSNETFLSGHPRLQEFLREHPEVLRQPRFYLAEFSAPMHTGYLFDELMEVIGIVAIWIFMAFALGWFIRTWIEQRRWKQLSKTQSEVHNKILDRFGTSEEVLEYIKTPAGARFLESAPIPLHAEKPVRNNPHARLIWSIQAGVIVVAVALGMLLISLRFDGENARGFFALGTIAFCLGAGFIGSAFVSMMLSRKLGAWQEPSAGQTTTNVDEPGLMR